MKDRLFKRVALIGLIIFWVNFLAMKFYWYYEIPWFDMPMHFFGGFFIGLLSIAIYNTYFLKEKSLRYFEIFIVSTAATFIIAILWEIFEFSLDTFITLKVQNIFDTTSDICFGLSGSFAANLYFGYNGFNETLKRKN